MHVVEEEDAAVYTEFIKPGVSMESRHFRTRQKNI